MEFIHRKELFDSPFKKLDLSNTDLLDLVITGKLQPFKRNIKKILYNHPPDPLSKDPDYDALYPAPIQKKYDRLRELQISIFRDEQVLSKSADEVWQENVNALKREGRKPEKREDFIKALAEIYKQKEQELAAESEEAAELEKEFKDIPELYREFMQRSLSEAIKYFKDTQLNDAYYRRDQIEHVVKAQTKGESISVKGENERKTQHKPAEPIYIAAADRAVSLIKDYVKDDILPQTIEKKLEMIKTDKKFMKIIAALPRTAGDKQIIRKLRKVRPDIWQMGKSSNKKYRPKSLYS